MHRSGSLPKPFSTAADLEDFHAVLGGAVPSGLGILREAGLPKISTDPEVDSTSKQRAARIGWEYRRHALREI